ncbi:MAG: DNA polymerase/3'-5' exonuclease PolX [Candidatus Omnitrophica bacterium]|nr:DNA polymerase/3'-5' exonuclease PolX [Candidatus Omnitrophota bacterium]
MKNHEIAEIFREIASILEIKGDNPFRIRAYLRAAESIDSLSEPIEVFAKDNRLKGIAGIGEDLSAKVSEYLSTGKIKSFIELKESLPEGVLELLNIPSVGPKTAKLLFEKLKISNIRQLEKVLKSGKLSGIPGIKEKTIANILKGIAFVKKDTKLMHLSKAMQIADEFLNPLENLPEVEKITVAGSLRRKKETVRDIDILITSRSPGKVMNIFTGLAPVKEILAKGETKSSIRTSGGVQVDCRVVEEKSFGAALLYFTGSKNFNIKIRQMAVRKGLKINEYGVFRKEKFICGRTEEEVLKVLGMAYVEPELREDTGEIQLALKNKLPHLLELKDIKGDLHVHSLWSDGHSSIKDMAQAARKRGYSYICVTDHSKSLKIANGLSIQDLRKKKTEIEKLNKGMKDFSILYGTEVDIDSNGNLDYPDNILKEFDVVIAAVHSGFKQSRIQLTKRVVKACKNKYVHIIAHPTGRLWGTRDAYEIDLEEVLKVAKSTNTRLEINSFPNRLDLNDHNVRIAKQMGVGIAINTDSHSVEQLGTMHFGVSVARRAWLEAKDVVNTLRVQELMRVIKK